MTNKTKKFQPKEVKREEISRTPFTEKIKDSKGKTKVLNGASVHELEIESVHLVKIAPMTFLCTDNNKILMIPFTIQFTQEQYLEHIATQSSALQRFYEEQEKLEKEAHATKK